MNLEIIIEKLISYAKHHLMMDELNQVYYRNMLLGYFHLNRPSNQNFDHEIKNLEVPDSLIEELEKALLENNYSSLDAKLLPITIIGLLSLNPADTNKEFKRIEEQHSIIKACEFLYNYQVKNYYIQKTSIAKNIKFKKDFGSNYLEITINLSKPEKNNQEIAKLIKTKSSDKYPQCLLCKDNIGFYGNVSHPGRGNLRVIPLKLNNEKWFFQYSPYCYYNQHCILINDIHQNMEITRKTFIRFLDFLKQFPHYFIGSNADLPIVGGSILNHEHYQGGNHILPMMKAKDRFIIGKSNIGTVSYLDWYNSCIKIVSKDSQYIINSMEAIRTHWKKYNNPNLDINAFSENTSHNTITPIMRYHNNQYIAYIILRNNATSNAYPEGIFHAHQEYHNIKKEGIGLIEAMGLFILPPRLKRESEEIVDFIYNKKQISELNKELLPHHHLIEELLKIATPKQSKSAIEKILKDYIADVCKNILINTAVFKDDSKGNIAASDFIKSAIKE